MNKLIELKNVNKFYPVDKERFHAIKFINLEINTGDFLVIMGKSGSGKTTLMNSLGFLDKFDDGEYIFKDKDVTYLPENEKSILRNRYMGFVFQQFNLIDSLTVEQNIELPLLYCEGIKKNKRREKIYDYLEIVGIRDKINRYPTELSGGQQQRVAIARALINDPYVIFADEPTGALDSENGKQIMFLLQKLNKEGKTIIMVTHDSDLTKYANKIIEIEDGEIRSVKNSCQYQI